MDKTLIQVNYLIEVYSNELSKEEIEKISFTFESIVRKMEERKQDDKKPAAKKKSSAS
jgi:hypothetical protein